MLFTFCIIISVGLLVATPVDKIKKQSYNPVTRPPPLDKAESSTESPDDKQTEETDIENGSSLEEKKSSNLSPEKGSEKLSTDTIQISSKKKNGVQSSENSNPTSSKTIFPIIENKHKGTYLILAPKVIRPGRPYFITFSVKNVGESMMVNIVIQRDGNNTLRNEIKVKEGKPVKVKFQIPENFRQGHYKLIAFGQDENQKYIVLNETDLEYQPKIASVFIQSDKPAYKRGQLVRLRVIITDPDLRPYTGPVNIYLNCALNYRIAQWEHVTGTSGVISIEYQLPIENIIGTNQIIVEIQDETIKEPLLVVEDEGVLPRFEVLVDSPNYVLKEDSATIHVNITAMYPFKKPVNGTVELILQEDIENNPSQVKQIGEVKNGEAAIEIPIKVIQFNKFNEEKNFIIIANVTDNVTGTYHTGSKHIIMFRDKYRVAVVPSSQSFKPGLNFQAWVKLEYFDGGFLPEEDVKINISYGLQGYEDKSWTKGIYPVPMIGLVELNILPDEETSMIYIKADYQGFKAELKITNKVVSASEKFIQITSDSPQYNAGDKAIFILNSTDPLPNINMAVFARNNIISTGSIHMKNRNSTKVSLSITEAMIPSALIVVYYLTDEGQILADSLNLTIGAPFANSLNISFYKEDGSIIDPEKDILLPGSQVLISGMTAPNAQVFINVMDESAYLLKTDDMLTVKGLYGELNKYQEFKKELFNRRSGPWRETNPLDACKLLKDSGFAVLTNGCELQEKMLESEDNYVRKLNAEVKTSPFSTTEVKGNVLPRHPTKSKIKVRRNFPETWLWIDTKASSDGKFENISIIPETMTTWIASAFSMDSISGLGLIDNPAKVRISRPFIVILNIPYSNQRNKNLNVEALVFLTANEPVEVTVKLDKSDFYEFPHTTEDETYSQEIYLEPGAYGKVSFNIVPLVTGIIPIRVSATSSAGRDSEERKIMIYPEGLKQQINETTYMTFGQKPKIARKFKVKIDKENVIPDSDNAVILIQGNGFGLPIKNVEQGFSTYTDKIVAFAQNLAVVHYLDVTSQFKDNNVVTKYQDLLKKDLDEILKLQKNDGSFAVPDRPTTGNPVITAFAIRYLTTLQNSISIDGEAIIAAEKWLEGKQSNDGSFGIESLYGIDNNLMDITSDDFIITLDILVNLLEAQYIPNRKEIIAATSYLEKFVNQSENAETLVKLAYALSLVKSPAADVAFQNLKSTFNVDAPEVDNVNIMVLSYLVPILINRGEIGKAQLFSRSISASLQITSLSTWETVRALNAMSLVAEYAYHPETEAQIEIRGGDQFSHQLTIDNDNVNLLQMVEVSHISNFDDIRIIAEGVGSFLVTILWKYNIPEPMNTSISDETFNLDVKSSFQKNFLVLAICCSFPRLTSMTVLNVEFPLGYEAYKVDRLVDTQLVYATETHDHNVFLFLNRTTNAEEQICIDVKTVNQNGHTTFHDIPVTLFDYKNPQNTMVMKTYSSPIKKSNRS